MTGPCSVAATVSWTARSSYCTHGPQWAHAYGSNGAASLRGLQRRGPKQVSEARAVAKRAVSTVPRAVPRRALGAVEVSHRRPAPPPLQRHCSLHSALQCARALPESLRARQHSVAFPRASSINLQKTANHSFSLSSSSRDLRVPARSTPPRRAKCIVLSARFELQEDGTGGPPPPLWYHHFIYVCWSLALETLWSRPGAPACLLCRKGLQFPKEKTHMRQRDQKKKKKTKKTKTKKEQEALAMLSRPFAGSLAPRCGGSHLLTPSFSRLSVYLPVDPSARLFARGIRSYESCPSSRPA